MNDTRPGRPATDPDSRRLRLLSAGPAPDPPFGQPSTYSLDQVTLARHVRDLRRAGWQSWEIRSRFFGAA